MMKYLFLGIEVLILVLTFGFLGILLCYIKNKILKVETVFKDEDGDLIERLLKKLIIFMLLIIAIVLFLFNNGYGEGLENIVFEYYGMFFLSLVILTGVNMLLAPSKSYFNNVKCILESLLDFLDNYLLIISAVITFLFFVVDLKELYFSIFTALIFYIFTEFSRIYFDEKQKYVFDHKWYDYVCAFCLNFIISWFLIGRCLSIFQVIIIESQIPLIPLLVVIIIVVLLTLIKVAIIVAKIIFLKVIFMLSNYFKNIKKL